MLHDRKEKGFCNVSSTALLLKIILALPHASNYPCSSPLDSDRMVSCTVFLTKLKFVSVRYCKR